MAEIDTSTRYVEEIVKYLREFDVPSLGVRAPESKLIDTDLADECHIQLDRNRKTPGMRTFCQETIGGSYKQYRLLVRRFQDLLTPYSTQLAKFAQIEERKHVALREVREAEEHVLRSWRHGEKYRLSKTEVTEAEENYKNLRDRNAQREPRVTPTYISIFIILAVGIVEWLINYDAFLSTFGVPVLAAGFTVAVAIAVAVASHFHGTYFKQREYYFGPCATKEERRWRIIWLAFVTNALLGAFVFVGWNRYSWAMDILRKSGGLGSSLILDASPITINIVQSVLMTMLSNFIVWVTGTALVFLMHDPNPEFAESFIRRARYRKIYLRLRSKIDDQIRAFVGLREQEIRALDAQRQSEENRDTSLGQLARWQKEVDQLTALINLKFSDIDQEAAERYRFALFRHPKASKLIFYFDGKSFGMSDYMTMTIRTEVDDYREH